MRRLKIFGGGDGRSPLLSDPKKPETIKDALIKHAKENILAEARVVKISRLGKTGLPNYSQQVDIAWVDENKANIEAALRDLMGGGKFRLQFQNDGTRKTWAYDFSLEGPNKGPRDGFEGEDGKPKAQRAEDAQSMLNNILLEMVKANTAQRASPAEEAKAQVEYINAITNATKGDGGDLDFLKQSWPQMLNMVLTQKEMGLENMVKMFEFMQKMQPSVEKDDLFTAAINQAGPILQQIIAAKQGAPSALTPAQAQQLQQAQYAQQLLQQQSPEQMAQLGQTVPVPGPGEPAQSPPVAQDTVPSTPRATSLDVMLVEFREDVAADAEIPRLALALHQMVAKAEYMAGIGAPHPMFAGLINQTDPMRLSHEFDRFTAAIPEFRQKADTAAAIKAAIAASYMPQSEPEVEAQQPPAEPAGDMVGQDDAANHLDTAGQTPGPEQPGTDNGAHPDQPDGPPIIRQPSKDDNAPLHV